MTLQCGKSLSVTSGTVKEIPDSWRTCIEGIRTEKKLNLRNSKKISRDGIKELGWSIWYQEIK